MYIFNLASSELAPAKLLPSKIINSKYHLNEFLLNNTYQGEQLSQINPDELAYDCYEWSAVMDRVLDLSVGLASPPATGGFSPRPKLWSTPMYDTAVFCGGLGGKITREELSEIGSYFGKVISGLRVRGIMLRVNHGSKHGLPLSRSGLSPSAKTFIPSASSSSSHTRSISTTTSMGSSAESYCPFPGFRR
ncbi:uncharacterized protein L201_005098 [Kwoniella dendrophila CBS 6074]|uniref:Uncharacterized protein n=1 Tax=Kwoniella dendrophila CBS 6074 TaxID=1295534 RepID=A0AAX4K045_9TREE